MKLLHFLGFLVKAIVIAFNTVACGREDTPIELSLRDKLAAEYASKLGELRDLSREHISGWPSDHDCDSALWAGIARAAGADWVEVDAGVRPNGRTTRRPLRDCVIPDESATSTSNDMITGLLLGALAAKDEPTIYKIYKYGEENNWVMGYPETYISRVLLRPNGITLMARILYGLSGGERDYTIRLAPMVYGPTDGDYESHLALLSRYMEQELGGPQYGAEWTEKYLAANFPKDALARAVNGDYAAAAKLLTGDYQSPSYVRGHPSYSLVHWLFVARVILDRSPNQVLDKTN
jgi:hypothetical protein